MFANTIIMRHVLVLQKNVSVIKKTTLFLAGVFLLSNSLLAQAIPKVQTWTTQNGAKVLFIPTKGIPMLDVRITFDAGSARDQGLSGLAVLTNSLLADGVVGMNAQHVAEAFESVGAQYSNDALRDMALLSLRTLTGQRYLQRALATFRKVLTQPSFPQKAFKRELEQMKVGVQASEQSPEAIASKAFYKAIYGNHPYASPVSGTRESLNKITLQEVRKFYHKYYVAKNATIAVVGEVTRSQAEKIIQTLVSALPAGKKAAALPAVKALTKAKTIVINYPSSQTHIYEGQPGIKRGDKDYFTLYMANQPFGGSGFSSRLMHVIREKNGLVYSVYSYFLPMRKDGPFIMGMQTRTSKTDEALSLLNAQLRKYLKTGPSKAELAASKSNVISGFPLNIDSNSKLLGYIGMIGFYDLPTDYLDSFTDHIKAVSLAEINAAMKRRLNANKMVTVIVGKVKATVKTKK